MFTRLTATRPETRAGIRARSPRMLAGVALAGMALLAGACGSSSTMTTTADAPPSPSPSLGAGPGAGSNPPTVRPGSGSPSLSDTPDTSSPGVGSDYKVDADMDQNGGPSQHPHVTGLKCDGLAGEWNLAIDGQSGLKFTLDENGSGQVLGGDVGAVQVRFIKGSPDKLEFSIPDLYRQTVTVTQGDFC